VRRILFLTLASFLITGAAGATMIVVNGPGHRDGPITSVSAGCVNYAGATCSTSAYFDSTPLSGQYDGTVSTLFMSAFDAWNTLVGGGEGEWGISPPAVFGLDDATFHIVGDMFTDPARAGQYTANGRTYTVPGPNGGLNLDVIVRGSTPRPGANQLLVWVQAIHTNVGLSGVSAAIVPAYDALDTSTLAGLPSCDNTTIFCPPAYPYQSPFGDQPNFTYQAPGNAQAFFDANAYLAIEDTSNDTLDLLDGISYGYQNMVVAAEPPGIVILAAGLLGLGLIRRRQSA
jgi:hypothetical protein